MSSEGGAETVELPLRVGRRTLCRLRRRLVRRFVSVDEALRAEPVPLPRLPSEAHGFYLRALPAEQMERLSAPAGMRAFVRQHYSRHFADLRQEFDSYLAAMSGGTRSGLKRKRRKVEERSGGALDVAMFRAPGEMEAFYGPARAISALTYQERLLDAGLPEGSLPQMQALAERGQVRAFLLSIEGQPAAYLYLPAEGETLRYAYLGYDPAFASLSPGTVLQTEAMRLLMDEGRFRWLDFTEGDGQHKRLFATHSVDSVDLLLLRPQFGNFAAASLLGTFDASVALGKRFLRRNPAPA